MIIWMICFILAIAVFFACNAAGYIFYRKNRQNRRAVSLVVLFLGVTFLSVFLLNLPFCLTAFISSRAAGVPSVVQSIRLSMQVFSLDGEYMDLYEGASNLPSALRGGYRIFGGILYVLAPVLLVGVVISFFQNVLDYAKIRMTRCKNIYVFSELNDRSLILARSCMEHDRAERKKTLIIFTDVYEKEEEQTAEFVDRAKLMGAVCLKSDILTMNADLSRKKGEIRFFILGSDESENIRHALGLMEKYGRNEKISLHVVTESEEGELLIGSAMNMDIRMEVRRINSARSMIYSHLYDTGGNRLFDSVRTLPDGEKVLRIILVGLGQCGTEFLRAFSWYGQLPGIRLEIHVFEQDRLAEQKFSSLCPEMMKMNHNTIDGECHYDIFFHRPADGCGMNVDTLEFDREIQKLSYVSAAYVTMGDDAANIRTAAKLRRLFLRSAAEEQQPLIRAVVYDLQKAEIVKKYSLHDFKGASYGIDLIGDMGTVWSYDVVVQAELEKEARNRHLKWVDKSADDYEDQLRQETRRFYQYEYFRDSSIASAIRSRVRREMNVPGTDRAPKDRTEEERRAIQKVEHAGWNAYMRSLGYCYAPKRNDLARLHHLLVPFDELPEEEKIKDDD